MRVIPSCTLWKLSELYRESDGKYAMFLEGKQD